MTDEPDPNAWVTGKKREPFKAPEVDIPALVKDVEASRPSRLSDWSDIIRQQGEDRIRREDERLAALEAYMPSAIAKLPEYCTERLLDLFAEWIGGRLSPRETMIRVEYAAAIRTEILRRANEGYQTTPQIEDYRRWTKEQEEHDDEI